jgi:predicted regulator of Ras-like GTPase activity (Roadblock/LC7/MglB family)
MTATAFSKLLTHPAPRLSRRRFLGRRSLLLGTTVALSLVPGATVAQASALPALAATTCSKVSAASVAAVVGHPVPAGTLFINHLKPTKADDEVSAAVTSCIYGSAVASLTALSKDVVVGFEVTSKALTGTELMHSLRQVQVLRFVFTPYAGLGMKAFYYSFTDGSIPIQGIAAIDGTTIYSSGLYTKTPAVSQLAALVKLSERL